MSTPLKLDLSEQPGRPRPVLLLAALIAAMNAFTAAGDLLNVLPPRAVTYVALASIVVAAFGGVIVQGAVTPLSSPKNSAGADLVPASAMIPAIKAAARAGAEGGVQLAMREQAAGDGGTIRP